MKVIIYWMLSTNTHHNQIEAYEHKNRLGMGCICRYRQFNIDQFTKIEIPYFRWIFHSLLSSMPFIVSIKSINHIKMVSCCRLKKMQRNAGGVEYCIRCIIFEQCKRVDMLISRLLSLKSEQCGRFYLAHDSQ